MKASSFLGTGQGSCEVGTPNLGPDNELGHRSLLGTDQEGWVGRAFSGSPGSWIQKRALSIAQGPHLRSSQRDQGTLPPEDRPSLPGPSMPLGP